MKFFAAIFIIGLACLTQYEAHPDKIPSSYLQRVRAGDLPPIWSYHIHCLFVSNDMSRTKIAMNLYERFQTQFNLTRSSLCTSTFNEKRLCMFDFEVVQDVDSPFVSGNWAVFVPIPWFDTTVRWVMQNRGDLDIFIHPNSGAEVSDHMNRALWGGRTWPINTSAFSNQTLF